GAYNNIGQTRLLSFDSTGTLKWHTATPGTYDASLAVFYSPNGQGYVSGINGEIYAIDAATGAATLQPFGISTQYAAAGLANPDSIAFIDNDYFIAAMGGGNIARLVRTQLSTGET